MFGFLNFRFIAYVYIVLYTIIIKASLSTIDIHLGVYLALPWVFYLIFDTYKNNFISKMSILNLIFIAFYFINTFYHQYIPYLYTYLEHQDFGLPLLGICIIINYFYPVAFVLLILELFHKFLKKLDDKYNINIFDIVLYIIAYYYIVFASMNDGFSGFLLGVPYAVLFIIDILSGRNNKFIKYLNIMVLICSILFIVTDRSKFKAFYPMVGQTYTINKDINYSHDDFYINEINMYSFKELKKFPLKKEDTITIHSQIISGHADFGTTYVYEISSKALNPLKEYINNNLQKIKEKMSKEYKDDFHEEKIKFYFGNKNKFYIHEYALRDLLKSQRIPYKDYSFSWQLNYYLINPSFYLLNYMFIFILSISLFLYRDFKNIFRGYL